jgi:hypothetical protein
MPARTPGLYGRRPHDPGRPALQLGNYLTGVVPSHPAAADYLARLNGGWAMLGNDSAGDCVAVTWANFRRLATTALTASGYYPTQAEVWAIYKTQNPDFDPNGDPEVDGPGSPADNGMSIQLLLEYLVKTGGPDGVKALGFAKVNHADPDEVKAAVALFGAVWTGINVLPLNQQQFGADEPWTWPAGSQPEGGHSVLTGGYGTAAAGADPDLGGDEKFITWADETSFTDGFWTRGVEECWVVIWPEMLGSTQFLAGVNLQALAADYQAITGKPFPATVPPAPAPTPQPTPSPSPSPSPSPAPGPEPSPDPLAELAQLIRDIAADPARGIAELEAWLEGHGL